MSSGRKTMTRTEMQADAKLVYNGTDADLLALVEKYNVTTPRLLWWTRSDRSQSPFLTSSDYRDVRSKLYATIKSEMRKAN